MATTVNYKHELERHRAQLAELLADREDVEVKIARLKKKVAAFAELCDESEFADGIDLDLGGLTDVCRTAMRASRKAWMAIADIQKIVEELGFPLDQYKAPAASITTTVNRLHDAGEVEVDRQMGETVKYKWAGKQAPAFPEVRARGIGQRRKTIGEMIAEG